MDEPKGQEQTNDCDHQVSKTFGHVVVEKEFYIPAYEAFG